MGAAPTLIINNIYYAIVYNDKVPAAHLVEDVSEAVLVQRVGVIDHVTLPVLEHRRGVINVCTATTTQIHVC